MDSEVPLGDAKTTESIPPQVSLASGDSIHNESWSVEGECIRIQRLSPRILGSVQVEGLPTDNIRPNDGPIRTRKRKDTVQVIHVNRRCGSSLNDTL